MAGRWETVKEWLGLTPPVADWDTVGVFPDLYGDEAAQAAPRAACGCFGDMHAHYVAPQPTAADLADPDQEWIDVTGFGDSNPRYVQGLHGSRPPHSHAGARRWDDSPPIFVGMDVTDGSPAYLFPAIYTNDGTGG